MKEVKKCQNLSRARMVSVSFPQHERSSPIEEQHVESTTYNTNFTFQMIQCIAILVQFKTLHDSVYIFSSCRSHLWFFSVPLVSQWIKTLVWWHNTLERIIAPHPCCTVCIQNQVNSSAKCRYCGFTGIRWKEVDGYKYANIMKLNKIESIVNGPLDISAHTLYCSFIKVSVQSLFTPLWSRSSSGHPQLKEHFS